MTIPQDQIMPLKGQGFLLQKDKQHFSCRITIPVGNITTEQSIGLGKIAEQYGRGYFSLTQRLDVEIPWIKYEEIEGLRAALAEIGLAPGGTGLRIRPISTCKGTVCSMGLVDTDMVADQLHNSFYEAYYNEKMPQKMRIGVAGCKNKCSKVDRMCLSLVGKKIGHVAIQVGPKEFPGVYSTEEAMDVLETIIEYWRVNGEAGQWLHQMEESMGWETFVSTIEEVYQESKGEAKTMEMIVRKPTEEEIKEMTQCPTWECEASTFDWNFEEDEVCLILEGKAKVTGGGQEITFEGGDLVIFPEGLTTTWEVSEAIKKHYK